MQAQAIVFPAPHQVEIQSFALPALREDELLIATEFSGVSQGTEIWALNGQRPELQFPTVPGYQSVGIVREIGAEVKASKRYQIGQRVEFRTSRLPENFPPTWMGAHISHAIVGGLPKPGEHGDGLPLIVPENVDAAAASLIALPAVSSRGIKMVKIAPGDLVVVMGQGLIGQSSAQLARLRGAIVVSSDIGDKRLQLSRAHSADVAVDVRSENLMNAVRAIKPKGADVVIETTGRAAAFDACIDLLRWEGQLLLQAWYPDKIAFDFNRTHGKKPTIAITCGHDESENAAMLELLRWKKLQLRELITHCVPFQQAPELYARMQRNDAEILGVVFNWTSQR